MSKEKTEAEVIGARLLRHWGDGTIVRADLEEADEELRRLAAANAELMTALKLARDRLAWFVEGYPQDITMPKSKFLAPFDAAIANHKQKTGKET